MSTAPTVQKTNRPKDLITASIEFVKASDRALELRLIFIDWRLLRGFSVGRPELVERFGISPALATKSFREYRLLYPENIGYAPESQSYWQTPDFASAYHLEKDGLEPCPHCRAKRLAVLASWGYWVICSLQCQRPRKSLQAALQAAAVSTTVQKANRPKNQPTNGRAVQ